ncbi:uracil-DNA glycosylase [Desulfolithobacter sp.]
MSVKKQSDVSESANADPRLSPRNATLLLGEVRSLLRFHRQLGISRYPASNALRSFLCRDRRSVVSCPAPDCSGKLPDRVLPEPLPEAGPLLVQLEAELARCTRCSLAKERQGVVPGQGSHRPRLVVVGDWSVQRGTFEAGLIWGQDEDAMFWKMMAAIGLDRETVYVTNTVKCCPGKAEVSPACEQTCRTWLERELAALSPRVICGMGESAVRVLLDSRAPLVRLRGRFHRYRLARNQNTRIMPTFHPRFLLRHPEMKKAAWLDLQAIQRCLQAG